MRPGRDGRTELPKRVAHQAGLGHDRRRRVKRIIQPILGRRGRRETAMPKAIPLPAFGSKPDSVKSCAASNYAAETFHFMAARRTRGRTQPGVNDGTARESAAERSPPSMPTEVSTSEHGAGPATEP